MFDFETSLAIQWLRLSAPTAGGTGLWNYDPAQFSQKKLMFDFYPGKKDTRPLLQALEKGKYFLHNDGSS